MEEERLNKRKKVKRFVKKHLLTVLLLSSVIFGCVIGGIIGSIAPPIDDLTALYLYIPGDALFRMLKFSATPMVVSCVIVALGSLNLIIFKRICWQLLILVFGTKILSSLVGLIVVLMIQPGKVVHTESVKWPKREGTILDIFLDMFRNIVAENMVQMFMQQTRTHLLVTGKNDTDIDEMKREMEIEYIDRINILGLTFIAIVVGFCLANLHYEDEGLYNIIETVYTISIKVATSVLWLSPWLIWILTATEILKVRNFSAFAKLWGKFLLTTHAGFLLIILVQYPLLIFLITRENPSKLFSDVGSALITAYATSSSMASMPLIIDGLLKHGLDPRLVRLVVPIGVNVNKDGAANFFVIATIFVAQRLNVTMTFGHYFTIIIIAIMSSVAAATFPLTSGVVLVMILNTLGLGQNWIGGALAVETTNFLNDRGVTLCNVLGNCCQPKLLAKWNEKHLEDCGIGTNEGGDGEDGNDVEIVHNILDAVVDDRIR